MKSYPYIGKGSRSGAVFLFLSEGDGLVLEQGFSSFTGRKNNIVETLCRNITSEYLANTYGEVKSKEHAEFIVRLAEVNNITISGCANTENAKWFSFRVDEGIVKLTFLSLCKSLILDEGRKQITIPLQPEFESVDEWPKVSDTVSLRYRFDSKQVMYTGELLYLSSNHIIIKTENGNDCHCIRSEWDIEKPKTPEQELNDRLYELCLTHCDSKFQASEIARKLMDKYNITKKPQ